LKSFKVKKFESYNFGGEFGRRSKNLERLPGF
jgi:hypothetical protein